MPSHAASSLTPWSSRGGTGAPKWTGDTGLCVRRTGEDEEQIGEPVEVDGRERVRVGNRKDGALRPAADRPREEEPGGALTPAGQDEALQIRQRRVSVVDLLLEPLDRLVVDPEPLVALDKRDGQIGAEIEELVLDAVEAAGPADERVELVDVA